MDERVVEIYENYGVELQEISKIFRSSLRKIAKNGGSLSLISTLEQIFKIFILNYETLFKCQNKRISDRVAEEKQALEVKKQENALECEKIKKKMQELANEFEEKEKKMDVTVKRLKKDKVYSF